MPLVKRPLRPEEAEWYASQGYDPATITAEDNVPDKPKSSKTSVVGATARGAGSAALPTIAGGAAAGGTMLAAPAIIAALGLAPETMGASLIPLVAALGAAGIASAGTGYAQQKLMPKTWQEQLELDAQEHPYATKAGQLATLPLGGFNPSKDVLKGGAYLGSKLMGLPTTREGAKAAVNTALGTGLGVAQEGAMQVYRGDFDPASLGESALIGSVFTKPNAIGRKFGFHDPAPFLVDQGNPELRLGKKQVVSAEKEKVQPTPSGPQVPAGAGLQPELGLQPPIAQPEFRFQGGNEDITPESAPRTPAINELEQTLKKSGYTGQITPKVLKAWMEVMQEHGINYDKETVPGTKGMYAAETSESRPTIGVDPAKASVTTAPHELAHHIWLTMPEEVRANYEKVISPKIEALNKERTAWNEANPDKQMRMSDPEEYFASEMGVKASERAAAGENVGLRNWLKDTKAGLAARGEKATPEDIYRTESVRLLNAQKRDTSGKPLIGYAKFAPQVPGTTREKTKTGETVITVKGQPQGDDVIIPRNESGFDRANRVLGWKTQIQDPTPGSMQSIMKYGHEVDRQRTVDAVLSGRKPSAFIHPQMEPDIKDPRLEVRTLENGAKVLIKRGNSDAYRELEKATTEYNWNDRKVGEALGYTDAEINEFYDRSRQIYKAQDEGKLPKQQPSGEDIIGEGSELDYSQMDDTTRRDRLASQREKMEAIRERNKSAREAIGSPKKRVQGEAPHTYPNELITPPPADENVYIPNEHAPERRRPVMEVSSLSGVSADELQRTLTAAFKYHMNRFRPYIGKRRLSDEQVGDMRGKAITRIMESGIDVGEKMRSGKVTRGGLRNSVFRRMGEALNEVIDEYKKHDQGNVSLQEKVGGQEGETELGDLVGGAGHKDDAMNRLIEKEEGLPESEDYRGESVPLDEEAERMVAEEPEPEPAKKPAKKKSSKNVEAIANLEKQRDLLMQEWAQIPNVVDKASFRFKINKLEDVINLLKKSEAGEEFNPEEALKKVKKQEEGEDIEGWTKGKRQIGGMTEEVFRSLPEEHQKGIEAQIPWATEYTDKRPDSPTKSLTTYVPEKASREEAVAQVKKKAADYIAAEEAKKGKKLQPDDEDIKPRSRKEMEELGKQFPERFVIESGKLFDEVGAAIKYKNPREFSDSDIEGLPYLNLLRDEGKEGLRKLIGDLDANRFIKKYRDLILYDQYKENMKNIENHPYAKEMFPKNQGEMEDIGTKLKKARPTAWWMSPDGKLEEVDMHYDKLQELGYVDPHNYDQLYDKGWARMSANAEGNLSIENGKKPLNAKQLKELRDFAIERNSTASKGDEPNKVIYDPENEADRYQPSDEDVRRYRGDGTSPNERRFRNSDSYIDINNEYVRQYQSGEGLEALHDDILDSLDSDPMFKLLAKEARVERGAFREQGISDNEYTARVARDILHDDVLGSSYTVNDLPAQKDFTDYIKREHPEIMSKAGARYDSPDKNLRVFAYDQLRKEGFLGDEIKTNIMADWHNDGYDMVEEKNPGLADWIDLKLFGHKVYQKRTEDYYGSQGKSSPKYQSGEEDIDTGRQGFFPSWAGTFDKLEKVSPKLAQSFRNWETQKDIYEGQGTAAAKDLQGYKRDEVNEVWAAHREAFRQKTPLPEMTGDKAKISDILTDYFHDFVGEERRDIGMEINNRLPGLDPTYVPDMLSAQAVDLLTNKQYLPEGLAAAREWAEHVHEVSEGAISLEEAKDYIKNYVRAMGSSSGNYLSVDFGPIRKAEGYGIPESLREKDAVTALGRYSRRASRDMAMFKELESPRETAAALELKDRTTGKTIEEEDVKGISGLQEVKNAMKWVTGEFASTQANLQTPKFTAIVRLVNNLIMGTATGLRDTATVPLNMVPYLTSFKDLGAALKGISDFRKNAREALEFGATKPNIDKLVFQDLALSPDKYTDFFRKMATWARKYQGREHIENFNRDVTFSIGKELAKVHIAGLEAGKESSKQWLKKFDTLVEGDLTEMEGPELDKAINTIAKNFTDRNQGTYGGRGLPVGMVDSQFAPFFSLQKWSLEKSNVIWQDVFKPFIDGSNRMPMLTYALGSVMTGAAISALNELLSNKKSQDPTIKEVLAKGRPEDYVAKLVSLMQLGSYAGIISDIAKGATDAAVYGKAPRNIASFPTASLALDAQERIAFVAEALQQGEDPVNTFLHFAGDMMSQNVQLARLMANHTLKADDLERSGKFRDLRVFDQLEGGKQERFPKVNPYVNTTEREFKRTADPARARELAHEVRTEAKDEAVDRYDFKQKMRSAKSMSYRTMPDRQSNPREYRRYYNYLVETQGKEEADNIVRDNRRQRRLNSRKAKMLP